MDEAEAVRRCREGDASAFPFLVERYSRLLFGTAYQITGDRGLAEDFARYLPIGLHPYQPVQVGDTTVERVEGFTIGRGNTSYARWQVVWPGGSKAEYMYTVSPNGDVKSVTPMEFDRARGQHD